MLTYWRELFAEVQSSLLSASNITTSKGTNHLSKVAMDLAVSCKFSPS